MAEGVRPLGSSLTLLGLGEWARHCTSGAPLTYASFYAKLRGQTPLIGSDPIIPVRRTHGLGPYGSGVGHQALWAAVEDLSRT